jgi:hypothetical protein
LKEGRFYIDFGGILHVGSVTDGWRRLPDWHS